MPTKINPLPQDSADAPTSKREDASDPKGVIERILNSAEAVLRSQGYAGFSTRRVAQEAEIALGNLTYHFPTKSGLVRALIDRLVSKYLEQFETTLSTPGEGLEAVVRALLEESIDHEAMSLFREIWVIALHDATIRESIDDFYDELIERVSDTLIAAHPNADPSALKDLVHLTAVMSEGSTVIYGTRPTRATSHKTLIELAVRMVSTEVARLDDQHVDEVR